METVELLEIISRDEDGKHQFKANITHVNSLASEMIAFSNAGGGQIFIGVNNDGSISGLTREDMGRLNQLLSNAASHSVRPPIDPQTENIALPDGMVMVVSVADGMNKPYMDNTGAIWVKRGADKRRVSSREEMLRMYQTAGLIHSDEIPANGLTAADLDLDYFRNFFRNQYEEELDDQNLSLPVILENMNLMKEGTLNIAGALLFAKSPQVRLPVFIVKCISYPGNDVHTVNYRDSEDVTGKLKTIFDGGMGFITRNIRRVQNGQGINSLGELEIPRIALEELVANALVHRDYLVSSPVRIFVFDNRIEIISPGHLPNNLTVEHIKTGNSNIRNPILTSFATKKILPYRGLGNGIIRALKAYPDIEFVDDPDGNVFTVTIKRPVYEVREEDRRQRTEDRGPEKHESGHVN